MTKLNKKNTTEEEQFHSIPKVIHYCWFGGKPLSELALKCIASWKKYCPNYEIKEWNENNFDVCVCDYAKEAYTTKKWAFLSDYARFKILYENGGVYFDTDVELIKSIDDISSSGAFMAVEADLNGEINPGLGMGMEAGHVFCQEIISYYGKRHFINSNGVMDQIIVGKIATDILEKHGYQRCSYSTSNRILGISVYSPEYFCPLSYINGKLMITDNTRAIHHFAESWMSKRRKSINNIYRICIRRFGERYGKKIGGGLSLPLRVIDKFCTHGGKKTIEIIKGRFFRWG